MVDEEVENILAEIRERVRAQELPRPAIVSSPQENGTRESAVGSVTARSAREASPTEALARIDSYLTVTSRAWDRLPPLVSNRSGSIASLEVWVKRQFKRATRWFTWEQVNFNASVNHALRDTVEALTTYERALEKLRSETEDQCSTLEQNQATLNAQREELQSQRQDFQAQLDEFRVQRAELQTQRAAQVGAQRKEMDARLAAFAQGMQERFEHLQEEQRVCFKQLSLEATEAAVLEDRARRRTESLLEGFKQRVAQIEKP